MSKRKRVEKRACWPEPRYIVPLPSTPVVGQDNGDALLHSVCRLFVDGACSGNHHMQHSDRSAGFGVYCEATEWSYSAALQPPFTNNRAELQAVVHALSALLTASRETLHRDFGIADWTRCEVRIVGDNEYVMNIATEWLDAWRSRNYCRKNGEPVLNIDLVQHLAALLDEFKERQWPLSMQWMRAHKAQPKKHQSDCSDAVSDTWRMWNGNRIADKLAVEGGKKKADCNNGNSKV